MVYKKKSYRKKRPNYGARKTYKIATRAAKKVISRQTERKHFYQALTNDPMSTTASVKALIYPTQGMGETERIGNEIYLRWIKLKYYTTVAAADVTNICRLMIIQWHVDSAVQLPGIGDILEDPLSNYAIVSPYINEEGKRRKFTPLYDKVITLSTGGPYNAYKKIYIPKGFKRRLGFNSNNVTWGLDQLFLIFVSDSGLSVHPTITWATDACFTDS